MTKPRSFHAEARMIDGIAHAGIGPPAGALDADDHASDRVDDAVARVEQPAPDERDDDPARDDRQEVDAAQQRPPVRPRIEREREGETADVDERQVADDVVDRVQERLPGAAGR